MCCRVRSSCRPGRCRAACGRADSRPDGERHAWPGRALHVGQPRVRQPRATCSLADGRGCLRAEYRSRHRASGDAQQSGHHSSSQAARLLTGTSFGQWRPPRTGAEACAAVGGRGSQLNAWPWSLLERPLATRTEICARIHPNPPGIERQSVTGFGETSVETTCNTPAFERPAGLICKQEVTGSNPVGSTRKVPAKNLFLYGIAVGQAVAAGLYGSVMEASGNAPAACSASY